MNKSILYRRAIPWGVAAALSVSGCVAGGDDLGDHPEEEAAPEIGSKDQSFTVFSNLQPRLINKVRSEYIIVCLYGSFVNDNNRTQLETDIRRAIMTWVGGAAPDSTSSLIPADRVVFSCTIPDATVNWDAAAGRANVPWDSTFVNMFSDSSYETLLHEFGHVFGLDDTYVESGGCQPGQPSSVMCNATFSSLQTDDTNAIREAFCIAHPAQCRRRWSSAMNWCTGASQQLHIGDFNGDGRSDMLCHDAATGNKWIALAAAGGTFTGTTFTISSNWCSHANGRLHVGKFNSDARSDLLCHDVANGTKWVWLAASNGSFTGSSWQGNLNWCTAANQQLHLGDFNGDGRSDLLCHDPATGQKAISIAAANGTFAGTTSTIATNWCSHANGRLHVGKFNGDARSDLLCHDVANGTKWVWLANSSGSFSGSSWQGNINWCLGNGQLFVGDFNADGRSDLLCHDPDGGHKWISFATTAGTFEGTSRSWPMQWCNHGSTAQLKIGNFNGDSADDFLCHDTSNGSKWVAYQRQ